MITFQYITVCGVHMTKNVYAGSTALRCVMADGYALATAVFLATFHASLCNLPPHNGFLDHYYHCAQSQEIVSRPRVFFRTNVNVTVFAVIPRGGFRKLGRLQCSMFLSRRIKYYSNASCAFNPAVYKILHSGDIEINPGYVPECTTRPQRQDYTCSSKKAWNFSLPAIYQRVLQNGSIWLSYISFSKCCSKYDRRPSDPRCWIF